MSGGGDDPKQQVTDYFMSIMFGVAHKVDAVLEIQINEKVATEQGANSNQVVVIDNPELFGGVKKEGGASGLMHVLLGGDDQVLSTELAARFNATPTTMPGYRGVTTLFFTGGGGSVAGGLFSGLAAWTGRFLRRGFYWTSNTPYLRPVAAKCRRIPQIQGFNKYLATVGNRSLGYSYFMLVHQVPGLDMKTALSQVVDGLKPIVRAGNRIDFAFAWFDHNKLDSVQHLNVTEAQLEALRVLIAGLSSPPTTVSDSTAAAFSLANSWFSGTVNDTGIGKRSLLFYSGMPDWTGGNPLPTGNAAADDMLTRTGGLFNTAAGTQVDCYAFILGTDTSEHTYVGYYDNTPEDGAPNGIDNTLGSADLIDAIKLAYYVGMFGRAGLTVNPAHIIMECLVNDDWGLGLPIGLIDLNSFQNAAQTLFDEGLGLAMKWSSQSEVEGLINDVLAHIDGKYGVDPATGKIYLTLIRGGYDVGTLFHLTPDNCRVTKFQRKTIVDTTNEVVVTYTNPENEEEVTVPVHDNANFAAQGQLVSSSVNYYGVRSPELAYRLGMRELAKLSAPLASLDVECDRSAWPIKSGDVVKITYPLYGLNELPLRVMNTTSGKPGEMRITLTCIEDVFEMPAKAYVIPSGSKWFDPSAVASAFAHVQLGTAPYYLLARQVGDANAAAAVAPAVPSLVLAAQGDGDTRSFDLYHATVDSTGATVYQAITTKFQAGWLTTGELLPLEPNSVIDEYANFAGDVNPAVGQIVWIGSGDPTLTELALVTLIDGSGLHLQRGALDTNIRAWPVGTPMWFLDPQRNYLDPIQRTDGVPVSYKLCPTTSQGTLPVASAPVSAVTPDDRIYRPYRPANVRINGAYWPSVIATASFTVAFAWRNRLLENPVVVPWDAADVAPEAGATVTARVYRVDTGALLTETTGITGSSVELTPVYDGDVRLELFSVRDGLESYQKFTHVFLFSATAEYRVTTTSEVRVLIDGQTRLVT